MSQDTRDNELEHTGYEIFIAILSGRLPVAQRSLGDKGALWIAWPKQSSNVATDLTEGRVRELGLATGLVDTKVCAIWNVRPTPLRQMARGARPATFSPASMTCPESGLSWPPTMLNVVDLPAPFGPMMARSSPA